MYIVFVQYMGLHFNGQKLQHIDYLNSISQ